MVASNMEAVPTTNTIPKKAENHRNEVQDILNSINVCTLCQLRFVGSDFTSHVLDDVHVDEGSHCSACLGILQGTNFTLAIGRLVGTLSDGDYDASTFNLGLSVPPCVVLREKAVCAYLLDNKYSASNEVPTVKAVAKYFVCKHIAEATGKKLDADSGLFLNMHYKYAANWKELSNLDQGNRKQHFNRKGKRENDPNIQNVIARIDVNEVKKYTPCPPHALHKPCTCEVNVAHNSLFIGGRYNKFSRNLSQTPWFIDGARRGTTSVLELIGEPLKQFTRGDEIKFLSAGREDIDVRMLGNGRPFAVEVLNPKTTTLRREDLSVLTQKINESSDGQVSVRDLQTVTKSGLEIMKKGEEEKSKRYTAKLWCPVEISDEQIRLINLNTELVLNQNTPIRVLHRRALATRLRTVHEIELKRSEEANYYEMQVLTQAGTYIKEFVHGDLGRTEPSLRTMLKLPIDIVELDVMSISLEWPPKVDEMMKNADGE